MKVGYKTIYLKFQKEKSKIYNLNYGEISFEKYAIKKEEEKNINIDIIAQTKFEAPVAENKNVGSLNVYIGEKHICKINMYTAEEIKKKDVWRYIKEIIVRGGHYLHHN